MKDRRSVDDLSIEELELVLKIKKSQVREERLRNYRESGRALQSSINSESSKNWSPPKRRFRISKVTSRILWLVEIN